jgi:hypothetical protein
MFYICSLLLSIKREGVFRHSYPPKPTTTPNAPLFPPPFSRQKCHLLNDTNILKQSPLLTPSTMRRKCPFLWSFNKPQLVKCGALAKPLADANDKFQLISFPTAVPT